MRFDIDENWLIDSDATAVSLYRRVVITGTNKTGRETKPENVGKVREAHEGSYGNLRDALLHYVVKSMRRDDKAIDITDLIAEMDVRIRAVERLAASFADKVPAPTSKPSTPLKLTPPLRPSEVRKEEPAPVLEPTPPAVKRKEASSKPLHFEDDEEPAKRIPSKPVIQEPVPKTAPAPASAPTKRRFVVK